MRNSQSLMLGSVLLLTAVALLVPVSGPSHATYKCALVVCTCDGDADCNDMFSTACGDQGKCKVDNGGNTSCACTKKASGTSSPPRKPPIAQARPASKSAQ